MQSLLYLALSNAILATLLAAFVAVVARFCRRPSVRHGLWLLVLLKLVTPPLLPLSVTWPRSEEIESLPTEPTHSAFILPEATENTVTIPHHSVDEADQPAEEALPQSADGGRWLPSFTDMWLPALVVVWLGGSLAWWIVAAARLRKFRSLLRQALPAAADVQDQGRRLAALLGLRKCPTIVFVAAPLSPMLWALGFSPRLLVPLELWRKLTEEQKDTLLAHELAHLRRGDQWVRRLELLVLGLYWWHPVVWRARRRLQEAEEECCDALVVSVLPDAAPDYASALVQTVAFLSQARSAVLVGVSGAGQVPLLKRRLTMILTETSPRKPSRIGFWIVLGMGAVLLPLAPRIARTEALEEPASVALDFGFPIADRGVDRHIIEAGKCAACHDVPMTGHGFHDKPQSWREAHDEIVRLMDELRRRQDEFHAAGKRPQAAAEPDRSAEIENLQDEIELLKIQVRLKEARVSGTKPILDEYRRRLKNYEMVTRSTPGAIGEDQKQETKIQVTTHEAQLRINEAELQEALLRVKQAERRLARLQRPAEKPDRGGRSEQEKRLKELEQKVENLLKEIHKIREDIRPKESRDPEQEYRALRGFVVFVWPTLDTAHLEENIPKAQKAFQMCKAAGDESSLGKLLTGAEGHVERLRKEVAKLHPDLVIEDEREVKKLKTLFEQLAKLGRDIKAELMQAPLGR